MIELKQLLASLTALVLALQGYMANPPPTKFSPKPVSEELILGAATGSGSFPTSTLNNFQDGDTINSADWNSLERKIGIDNSTDTTSLDYKLRSASSSDPGHKHTTSSVTGYGTFTNATATNATITNLTVTNATATVIRDAGGNKYSTSTGATGNSTTSYLTIWNSSSSLTGFSQLQYVNSTGALTITATTTHTGNLETIGIASSTELRSPSSTLLALRFTNASGTDITLTGTLVVNGVAYTSKVTDTRQILAGTGLSGGGDLSADRTLTNIGVTSLTASAPLSRDVATGTVNVSCPTCLTTSTGLTTANMATSAVSQFNNDVPYATSGAMTLKADKTITITGATGLSGGGDLSANRTITPDLTYNFAWTGTHNFQATTTLASSTYIQTITGLLKATAGLVSQAVAGTDYVSSTLGNWAGTWQGVNSSTFYLVSNPSNYISTSTGLGVLNFTTSSIQQWNTGIVPLSQGGTNKSSFTAGSLVFASGTTILGENNAKLFWDNVNNLLGIGTSKPSSTLHIIGDLRVSASATIPNIYDAGGNKFVTSTTAGNGTVTTSTAVTANYFPFWNTTNGSGLNGTSSVYQNGLNVGIGTSQPSSTLHVVGDISATGNVTTTNLTVTTITSALLTSNTSGKISEYLGATCPTTATYAVIALGVAGAITCTSTLASSSKVATIYDATTTGQYAYALLAAPDYNLTIANFNCQTVIATTTYQIERITSANATSGTTMVTNLTCGTTAVTTSTIATSTVLAGQFMLAITSSTSGTPTRDSLWWRETK